MLKIQPLSKLLYRIFLVVSVLYPLIAIITWLSFGTLPSEMQVKMSPIPLENVIWNQTTQILIFFAVLPESLLSFFMLKSLSSLFALFSTGRYFSLEAYGFMHRTAKLLAFRVLVGFLMNPCIGWVLSFQNFPGKRILSLTLSSEDISWLLVASVLLVLSKIMLEARSLEEDSKLTV